MQLSYFGDVTQRTDFSAMACSIARAWAVIGEPWTPLIIRDLSLGFARFDDVQADLGIARSTLTDRLRTLEQAGVIVRRAYPSTTRTRQEYVLTEMGQELVPLVVAISRWGDRWLDDGKGPPIVFRHVCGTTLAADLVCAGCRRAVVASDVSAFAGPGSALGPGTNRADVLPSLSEPAETDHPD